MDFGASENEGLYQGIATGLAALAMTVVVGAQLRQCEQYDKLKFEFLFSAKIFDFFSGYDSDLHGILREQTKRRA